MSELKRIIFVDDDESVLAGLRRLLRRMDDSWSMEFYTSPLEALEKMKENTYDIIVSDLRMSEMGGAELIAKVRDLYPDMTRIMLSGCSEQPKYGKSISYAHQFIAKPCDSENLIRHLTKAFAIRDKIRSEQVAKVLPSLQSLPAMPAVYRQVLDLLDDPRCSCRDVGQLISKDIGMSAKILQVVNSAFYGPSTQIADPVRAAVYLGVKAIKALMLTDGVFSTLPDEKVEEFHVAGLHEHCLRVGSLAKSICRQEGLTEQQQETAMMAGILHDTGKVILISEFDYELREIIRMSREQNRPCYEIEREIIHLTHGELGGCLLNLWGLGNDIIEAATFHHEPVHSLNESFSVGCAVYIANSIDHKLCSSLGDGCTEDIDTAFLEGIGVSEKMPDWLKMHLPSEQEEYEYA